MNVKDGYLFPLVFEDSCGFRYTDYVDDNIFRFVSNQSGEVWTNDCRFSFEQFKLYVKDGSWKILTPQFDQTKELDEAYAKIDTLESALEDAVKRLDNWRNGRKETYGLEDEDGEGKLTENELQFKPINEMTLEDWLIALDENAVFEFYDGTELTIQYLDKHRKRVGFNEQSYLFSFDGHHLGNGRHIIKRIR